MLTAERLREILSYDKETGIFKWRVCLSNRAQVGAVAGNPSKRDGYIKIGVDGKIYMGHRLVWLYVTGEWPRNLIDHINCNGSDNRFANLREATHSQNLANLRKPSANTSGHKGVSWDKFKNKWVARAKVNGRQYVFGYFVKIEDAVECHRRNVLELVGTFARFE